MFELRPETRELLASIDTNRYCQEQKPALLRLLKQAEEVLNSYGVRSGLDGDTLVIIPPPDGERRFSVHARTVINDSSGWGLKFDSGSSRWLGPLEDVDGEPRHVPGLDQLLRQIVKRAGL